MKFKVEIFYLAPNFLLTVRNLDFNNIFQFHSFTVYKTQLLTLTIAFSSISHQMSVIRKANLMNKLAVYSRYI